ncbi:hypothetical protein QFZ51_002101 [Chitinophaga sp. W3I9]
MGVFSYNGKPVLRTKRISFRYHLNLARLRTDVGFNLLQKPDGWLVLIKK